MAHPHRFHYYVDLQVAAGVLKLVITDLQGPQKDPGIGPHHGNPGYVGSLVCHGDSFRLYYRL